MALTDADRLQMTVMALMRHNVVTVQGDDGLISQPMYTQSFDPTDHIPVNQRLDAGDYYSTPTYSYVIE